MGYIYKTTNIINGKVYIGQTKKTIEKSSSYIGSGKLLLKAIKEYGKDSFVKEIIEEIDSHNHNVLDERETYWIVYYDSANPSSGYNITKGGSGWSSYGIKRSDETRKKQSEKRKGKEPWNKGKTNVYSKDQIQRMLDNRKIKNGFKQKPKYNWICPKGVFEKRKDVADLYGVSPQMISFLCNDETKPEFRKEKIIYE
jgi:group I intron endonuclease